MKETTTHVCETPEELLEILVHNNIIVRVELVPGGSDIGLSFDPVFTDDQGCHHRIEYTPEVTLEGLYTLLLKQHGLNVNPKDQGKVP